jgi:hypothetical protein
MVRLKLSIKGLCLYGELAYLFFEFLVVFNRKSIPSDLLNIYFPFEDENCSLRLEIIEIAT